MLTCLVVTSLFVTAAEVADVAREGPHGTLTFTIADVDTGDAIPGRLTFIGTSGGIENLFTKPLAAPRKLAVRKNVVYARPGEQVITVPVGTYTVLASRGLEWSVAATTLDVSEGSEHAWTPQLAHEVDTTGWISGDFHLHTLTHSGHGDSNMLERIISIAGEGVEFAVATDHNHHTDYGPSIAEVGAEADLTAVTGNEVSVPVGHFNAFPLDPARPPVDAGVTDANELFRLLRAETNPFGIVPVIQVNHPRWDGIDYFRIAGLDPVTALSDDPDWSSAFDTIEVLNENTAWGYYEAHVDDVDTAGNLHSAVQDWFNLLNRGHRYAAVGNSDSHTVHYALAGYPRNFVRSATDDAAAIDPADVAASLLAHQVFTTVGPFVTWSANGTSMGGQLTATDGRVELDIRVQAASWIDVDRVKIVVNGDVRDIIAVPPVRTPERLRTRHAVHLAHDAWITLLVEGDDAMAPLVDGGGRPVLPLAVTNPVWVDVDSDGTVADVWTQAATLIDRAPSVDAVRAAMADLGPTGRGFVALAAAARYQPWSPEVVADVLAGPTRREQLLAAHAARGLAAPSLKDAIDDALVGAGDDPQLEVNLLRALAVTDPNAFERTIREQLEAAVNDPARARVFLELEDQLPGAFVRDWGLLGYFDAPTEGTVLTVAPPRAASHEDRTGRPTVWRMREAAADGRLDLRGHGPTAAAQESALIFARTRLVVPTARDVLVTLGTDDGSRVWLNGAVVYANAARRAAHPLEHVAVWPLKAGENEVVFAVENGTGGYALYLRVLDSEVVVKP